MAIVDIFQQVEEIKQDLENLSVDDLKMEMAENPDILVIDIREIQELVELGTIPGSVHVPRGMMEFWASPTSPYYREFFKENTRIVAFCAGGGRSAFAARDLKAMGFTDVAHLEPGFNGWSKQNSAVEDFASKSRWVRKPTEESAS
ncbi:MAG: rhodanese-like domain-containing protein [Pseudohongiellaceae bacterium]|jgi:rhodanese-related sulfurtransferase